MTALCSLVAARPSLRMGLSSNVRTLIGIMAYLLVPQVAKSSPRRTVSLSAVGNGSGNPQFQLSPSSRPAPRFQVRTDFRGALSHSSHPPVARFATGVDNSRIDTRTVVTKPQTQV